MGKRKYSPRKRIRRVSIRAERREEPDWDRFAWALLQHVKIMSEQAKKRSKP
jgi:hypothetical protein